jgi:hypothetical protein
MKLPLAAQETATNGKEGKLQEGSGEQITSDTGVECGTQRSTDGRGTPRLLLRAQTTNSRQGKIGSAQAHSTRKSGNDGGGKGQGRGPTVVAKTKAPEPDASRCAGIVDGRPWICDKVVGGRKVSAVVHHRQHTSPSDGWLDVSAEEEIGAAVCRR